MSAFETDFNELAMPGIEDEFGVDVYLRSGSLKTATFVARRDRREHSAFAEELQIGIRVEQRVFYLPVASCLFGTTAVEPQPRWRIYEVVSGDVWEIHYPDNATKAVERDTNTYDWRCHVKLFTGDC